MVNPLAGFWTQEDLCHIFDKSLSTIWFWRRNRGLPFIDVGTSKRAIIRFHKKDVRRWAKATGIPVINDPEIEKSAKRSK